MVSAAPSRPSSSRRSPSAPSACICCGGVPLSSQTLAATINDQIISAVGDELQSITTEARSSLTAVRTWVTQKVIDTRDVTKRESVFISQLRSQPTISWVAFGGSFFAGHKLGDSGIETMEIAAPDRKLRLKQFEYVGTELEPRGSRVEDTIIIGPETRRLAGDRIVVRELDRLAVYGRAGGLQIYELLGMASEFEGTLNWVASYEAGLAAWRAGDFAAAIGAFENVLQTRKTDAASSLMIERCQHQHDNRAGDGWDGTSVALTK